MKNAKSISFKDIENYESAYNDNRAYSVMENALSKNDIGNISFVSKEAAKMRFKFSIDIPTMKATTQQRSGRCWIFAGLNVLREIVAKKENIQNFELSQNYIAFWDKFEKINYLLETVLDMLDVDSDDRTLAYILQTGIGDGGQWDMFVNLVEKYGVCPKDAMPETFQSSQTGYMNKILNTRIRMCSAKLRKMYRDGADFDALQAEKQKMLKDFYAYLCMCFSEPPKEFDFEFVNKDKEYKIEKGMTPESFKEKYIGSTLSDYVSIINAPTQDKPYDQTYTVNYLGNVVGGKPVTYLNLEMGEFKNLVLAQLKDKEVVWFGSDVGKYGERKLGIWDDKSFDFESAVGLDITIDKADLLDYRDGAMNHAMVLTGVNLDEDKPNRWKIENSWGTDAGNQGYYMCSDTWFDKFVFQAVVNKKYLTESMKEALKKEPVQLNPWDPMGTLA